ncbi:MAG TPA: hypothetical protein VFG84_00120 [Gemmatimonadaceae bacterium]|nr:hypothetical protein [Gemmatimonadaceae bacterium]
MLHRILAATIAACAGVTVLAGARPAGAQTVWNDARTRALVERATERRAQQLADTGLVDYAARAHGYVTFLAQVGEGFPDPPKIVKADELALEVYWAAPDLSKQRIVGQRDTLLLPTDINYHRDHLGIIQNNFPSIIRLGDGDEVRDVAHPLSADGLATYDYAISDSIRIRLPDRTIDVYEVKIRPRDDRDAAAVGAIYLDRAEGQVVRMAFSFTRAALKDRQLDDVAVVLENALIENRFWLPRRQEIEIRRTGSWMDFPARGIIRGRWEICCYEVNQGIPRGYFNGPEITRAPASELASHEWTGTVMEALPADVSAATDADVARIQEEARALVRAGALARTRQTTVSARSVSALARVNRAEGLALGGGLSRRLGRGLSTELRGRWGFADHRAKGEFGVRWEDARGRGAGISAFRRYRDASLVAETSGLRNSIAAQEFGSDYTEPYDAWGGALSLSFGEIGPFRWKLEGGWERQRGVEVAAMPSAGHYEPTIRAMPLSGARASLLAELPERAGWFGSRLAGDLRLSGANVRVRSEGAGVPAGERLAFGRLSGTFDGSRELGSGRLVLATAAAVALGPDLPAQELVYLGGPRTGPGYRFHEFTGRIGVSQRVEWQVAVPFMPLPLGRYGNTGSSATLAPFAHVVYVSRVEPAGARGAGWYPSVGVGLLTIFDLVRLDVARGVRDGRWTFGLDIARDFWGIL